MLQRTADGDVMCRELKVIETKGTPKKLMRGLRVSADDYQRIRQIHFAIRELVIKYNPVAIAYEVYQPFTGKVKGKKNLRASAWKVSRVEGVLVSIGLMHELLILPYLTLDLKGGIAGNRSATKTEVQTALRSKIRAFAEAVDVLPKTKREHVSDAAGYAYLAFAEMDSLAKMTGVVS